MCGALLESRTANTEFIRRLGIECITDVIRRNRLRWFGHAQRKDRDDWIGACRSFEDEGVRYRGRGRTTLDACVKTDLIGFELFCIE